MYTIIIIIQVTKKDLMLLCIDIYNIEDDTHTHTQQALDPQNSPPTPQHTITHRLKNCMSTALFRSCPASELAVLVPGTVSYLSRGQAFSPALGEGARPRAMCVWHRCQW